MSIIITSICVLVYSELSYQVTDWIFKLFKSSTLVRDENGKIKYPTLIAVGVHFVVCTLLIFLFMRVFLGMI